MGKNMAVISNGIVENIVWCSDEEPETETLIEYEDALPVGIGDSYIDGVFYRTGKPLKTTTEMYIELLVNENEELFNALAASVEEIFQNDMAIFEE